MESLATDNTRRDEGAADDDLIQRELGYKQELYRGVRFLGSFAIGFSNSSSWLGIVVIFQYAMTTGGPGPLVWGFLGTFAINMCVVCVMAEICSAFPQVSLSQKYYGVDRQ
jgi:choline transport protein